MIHVKNKSIQYISVVFPYVKIEIGKYRKFKIKIREKACR